MEEDEEEMQNPIPCKNFSVDLQKIKKQPKICFKVKTKLFASTVATAASLLQERADVGEMKSKGDALQSKEAQYLKWLYCIQCKDGQLSVIQSKNEQLPVLQFKNEQ